MSSTDAQAWPDPALDWAASGAMSLTGAAAGPPRLSPGAPTLAVRRALATLPLPPGLGPELLGERAALAGLRRRAPWSVGGAFRALPTRDDDGWLGISLPRPSDLELVPALVQDDVAQPWDAVERWAAAVPLAIALERALELGLAACAVGSPGPARPGVRVVADGQRRTPRSPPVVLDLTALWAGPLCAHLLGLCGARVIKVESRKRLDGARRGPAAFFDLLHAGHESVVLDLPAQRDLLAGLLERADVVLEASRPRALAQLGIAAERHVARGTVWAALTAYGRDQPYRIGFGDDVAAAAGLVADVAGTPTPVGDAIADPLAGVATAAAVWDAVQAGRGCHLDVSMAAVAAEAAALPGSSAAMSARADGWIVRSGASEVAVAPPRARVSPGRASAPGRHTARILRDAGLTDDDPREN